MGVVEISHLITDARSKPKSPSIAKFSFQLAGQAEENVAFLAPVVGAIAGRVFDDADPNRTKFLGSPQRDTGLSRILDGCDVRPLGDAKRDFGDSHPNRR